MIDGKDFKRIADEAMEGIKATDRLKRETLRRCAEKRRRMPAARTLAYAACILAVLVSAKVSGLFGTAPDQEAPPNILMQTGVPFISTEPGPGEEAEWLVGSYEEAKELFGEDLETPAVLPSGSKLDRIDVTGTGGEDVTKAVFSYTAEGGSFILVAERTELFPEYAGFEETDLNGVTGYIRSSESGKPDTELYWFKNGIRYSIIGSVTKDDAVQTALSMQ